MDKPVQDIMAVQKTLLDLKLYESVTFESSFTVINGIYKTMSQITEGKQFVVLETTDDAITIKRVG